MTRHLVARLALWLGYRCLAISWRCLHDTATIRPVVTPTLAAVPLQALTLRDDVVTALLVAQEHRIRQGQERVH